MSDWRALAKLSLIALALVFAPACHRGTDIAVDRTVKLITSDLWPWAESIPILKQEMARQGFVLEWVVVNDIIQPNKLVEEGAADANQFQHEPYFDQFARDHGLRNVARAFYTMIAPAGLYSKKYKSLEQLPDGATFGIPVDPANNGRALFMLRDKGLLKLNDGVNVIQAGVKDIIDNPHRYKFLEVDQLMQMRTLPDVDAGFLFVNYAIMSGFKPKQDALVIENVEHLPYKGIVAVRKELVGTPKIKALQNAYASEAYKDYFRGAYRDAVVFLDDLNR